MSRRLIALRIQCTLIRTERIQQSRALAPMVRHIDRLHLHQFHVDDDQIDGRAQGLVMVERLNGVHIGEDQVAQALGIVIVVRCEKTVGGRIEENSQLDGWSSGVWRDGAFCSIVRCGCVTLAMLNWWWNFGVSDVSEAIDGPMQGSYFHCDIFDLNISVLEK